MSFLLHYLMLLFFLEGQFMKIKKFICKYKWDILCNLILVIIYLLIISIKSRLGNYILGSTTDFETQHYLIPE